MADEQAMARVRLWWQGLDADTQMMFDKLYRSDPANVLAVISDGSLTDLGEAATLDEAFTYARDMNAGGPDVTSDTSAVPVITVKERLVIVEPVAPAANDSVTVRWTEVNEGAQSQGHVSSVAWFVDNQWVQPIEEVIAGPMAHREEAERTITLAGVAAGEHVIYVTANADGNVSGSGAIPQAGIGQMASALVRVGGGYRPNDPSSANSDAVRNAQLYLSQAAQAIDDLTSLQQAAQALYSFAGSLETGGEVVQDEQTGRVVQTDQRAVAVVQRAQALEAVDADAYAAGRRAWQEELFGAIEAISQIADGTEGGGAAYDSMIKLGSESFGLR
jgi:hypothetical protein